ncbi:MAG: VCBS repeat-containing protein [Chthoniobacteraceae bacterium]
MKKQHLTGTERARTSFIEPLESRIAPSTLTPLVTSINRSAPVSEGTAATSVTFAVDFNEAVTGVDAADFHVFTSVNAKADALVAVATTADPTIFNVTVSGLKGNGDVRLDLVDNDTILFTGVPLGGTGVNNGSFTGQTYHLLQAGPSANFTSIGGNPRGASSVSWTLTFSEPVTGVDSTDFTYGLFSGLTGTVTISVTPVTGTNGAGYTVTATGYTGTGSLSVNLKDDGTIKSVAHNDSPPSGPVFSGPTAIVTNKTVAAIASGDVNGDGKPDIVLGNYSYSTSGSASVSVLLGNGDGTFQTQQDFAAGYAVASIALADVNGDGKPDIVVTGGTYDPQVPARHFVSVLLGNGDGSFQPRRDFGNNTATPGHVAVGDMNNDGKPDLVVTTTSSDISTVNVLLGNGNGTFQTEQTFSVGVKSNDVQVADVNGDGKADVITANFDDRNVSVLLGTGTGSFSRQDSFDVSDGDRDGDSYPNAVAVGDMDGDGTPDLVVAGQYNYGGDIEGYVAVLLGNGDGTFDQPFETSSTPGGSDSNLSDVQLADFDGDGILDIAVTDRLRFPSAGSFGGYIVESDDGDVEDLDSDGFYTNTNNNAGLTVADFNGDGRADIATANGNATSAESPPEPGVALQPAPSGGTDVLLNFGGTAESVGVSIVVPHVTSIDRATPTILDSGNTAATSVTYTVYFDRVVTGVDAADFRVFTSVDAKANATVVVTPNANPTDFTVTVSGLQGNGEVRLDLVDNDTIVFDGAPLGGVGANNGSFTGETYHLLQVMPTVLSITGTPPLTTGATSMEWTVTFSEDVTGVNAPDFVFVFTGATAATTGPTVVQQTPSTYKVTAGGVSGAGTIGLKLVDDETIRDSDNNPLQTVQQPNPPTTPGVSFEQPQTAATGNRPVSIASGDVNGDGKPDIVTANSYASGGYSVSVLLGNGDGTFQSPQNFATGSNPQSVALADVNGDGRPDIVVTGSTFDPQTSTNAFVSVLLGNGDGTFQARQNFGNSFSSATDVAVGDMNQDGRPDLVVLTASGLSIVNVLLGNGDGTFQMEQTFPVNVSSNDVQVADVNGDGNADVVTANFNDESVSVLLGTGTGSLGTATAFGIADEGQSNPNAVAVGDMNGDGKPDLVTAGYSYYDSSTGGQVTVMLGAGDGTFTYQSNRNRGSSLSDVQLADFNGDGNLDIAASDNAVPSNIPPEGGVATGTEVWVFLGSGDGRTGNVFSFNTSAQRNAELTVADFNGDGKADIATANDSGGAPAALPEAGALFVGTVDALLNNGIGDFNGEVFTIVLPDPAIIDITDGLSSAAPGDTLTFTISYANQSEVSATGAKLTLPLDSRYNFVASENPGWTESGGVLTRLLGTLGANASGTASLTLHIDSVVSGFASGLATVTIMNDNGDETEKNNSDTDFTFIPGNYTGFVVTAPGISPKPGKFAPPIVQVFDKSSGDLLYAFSAYESTYRDSIRVAVGDFNGDGIDDIVTTTQHNGGRLRIFDGSSGLQFSSGPLGPQTARGDVLDPFGTSKNKGAFVAVGNVSPTFGFDLPEIVVGSSLISRTVGGGTVKVYSLDSDQQPAQPEQGLGSGTLQVIKEFTPFGARFKGGVRVAVGDVDRFGDDKGGALPENGGPEFEDDIIVGQGFRGATVKVYKGVTDTVLGEFKVGTSKFRGGVSVAVGDVNDDGFADIIVGRNTGRPSVLEVFDGRSLLSGNTPTQIGSAINPFDIDPLHPRNTFGVRVAAADVNGDGVADIIASAGLKNQSAVKFYDGRDFLSGTITEITDRRITAYSDFPNVALWIAASDFDDRR